MDRDRYKNLREIVKRFSGKDMRSSAVDPLFAWGDIGMAYDETDDRVCIIAKETASGEEAPQKVEGGIVRYWAHAPSAGDGELAMIVGCADGRSAQCGEPMEPEGPFLPQEKRT